MEASPILISLKTALYAIVITFFLGIAAAKWIVFMKNRVTKVLLDGLFTLPLVLPPTVAGFFLLYLFGVKRPIGKFFVDFFAIKIPFSWGATVLAAVVISFPLMYRSARGAFEQVDERLLFAGQTLGMSEWRIFYRVLLPNALPGILSGGILAFARRIWSDDDDCRQHRGRDENPAACGIFCSFCGRYGVGIPICHCAHLYLFSHGHRHELFWHEGQRQAETIADG